MRRIILLFALAIPCAHAQVQIGKGVQIGFGSGSGSGTVNNGTAGQIAQFPSNGTTVQGATVSGDASLAIGGALTLTTVNSSPGTCGDGTHIGQATVDAKGRVTACTAIPLPSPFAGANGVVFNTSATTSRNATFSDIVPLWGGGSCSGFLKSDGTCGSSGTSITLQTNGTNNANQALLNLTAGSNVSLSNSGGTVTINAASGTSNGPIFLFGTSVTEGVGSFVNGNSYADILATDSGNALQNWGVGGSQAADMVLQTFRKFSQSSIVRAPLTIFDPFINDANHCGNTTGCLANAGEALDAAIAWVDILSANRIYATAATNSGFSADTITTFTDRTLPAIGMFTRTQNATLTFNLTNAGSEVGLTFAACDAYTSATFTVTLGATLVDTINPIGNSGQTILTQNGQSCTLFRKEYTNTSGATVSLVVQKTDATTTAAGTVSIWAVDSNPSGAATGAGIAWVEGTIMQNNNANAAATSAFDTQANTIATAFRTDGWNSYYVPLRAGQTGANPGVNSTTDMANNGPVNPNESVGLHPNSGPGGGHAALAQTIENFGTANGMPYFNPNVSGGHNFFYSPITQFQHYNPTNILGYNNYNPDNNLSMTALMPGGTLNDGFVAPNGLGTFSGTDLGYDSAISSYIGRSFASAFYEICPFASGLVPSQQSDFGCGHDIWASNGDYWKRTGFFRLSGGYSYEGQRSAAGNILANNGDRLLTQNFINTSAGNISWMLPLCKTNTYDYQLWYYKSTGDTNSVQFNTYNTADSINGNTSSVTGPITAYSINGSNVGTFTAANTLVAGQAVTLSGFVTSVFLNGVNGTITAATSTTFTMAIVHSAASATENGTFGVNASWTGLSAPYSAAVVQCSVGPTGANTIQITQSDSNASGAGQAARLNASNSFTGATNTFLGISASGPVGMGSNSATSISGNLNSPTFEQGASWWNGSAAVADTWISQVVLGSGTNPSSTLTLTHSGGTSGPVSESFVGAIAAPANAQVYTDNSAIQITGLKFLSGKSTLASGTVTVTFPTGMFVGIPTCTMGLVDGGASPGATEPVLALAGVTASGLTVIASDASSSKGVNWTCIGN